MIRVRFAPSPTGFLHIGNVRTALFNYLFVKNNGGKFILRIEDTDKERSKKEYINQIYDDLKWLGITWDEGPDSEGEYGPYLQSERFALYISIARKLMTEGKAYYCYCTEEELELRRKAQLAEGQSTRYDNYCRNLTLEKIQQFEREGRQPSIRFKMPDGQLTVKDIIRGDVEFDASLIGDFIIIRPDGKATFHLAVCVDDGMMKISHVIRGEDHFSNTPRHVAIFEACGFQVPQFAHIPLTMGPGGEPLSKRFGAMSITEYRRMGYLPYALCNYMALLGWSSGTDEEIFSFDELQKKFSLKRVSRSAAIFDRTKMDWVGGEHIRRLSDSDYVKLSMQHILQEKIVDKAVFTIRPEWYEKVLLIFKEYIHCFDELKERLQLFNDKIEFDTIEPLKGENAKLILSELAKILKQTEKLDEDNFDKVLKELKKRVKVKGKELFLPLRIALTGKEHGPELKQLVILLGKNNCLKRIEQAVRVVDTKEDKGDGTQTV